MTTPPSSQSPTATVSNAVNGSANANADPNGNTNNNPNAPRSQRPPPRSNFDLEPNPFEHSFSSTSVVSHSSATETPKHGPNSGSNNEHTRTGSGSKSSLTMTNGVANGNTALKPGDDEDSKPTLPPLAALESPAGQNYASWALASSLRSGPLSPAMLAGPTTQQTPSLGLGAFDGSFVRTGLTPDVSRTGLTPLIGGPGGFPPPSPNTAALFALVSGTSAGAALGSNVAITPGTLNALTGALNQSLGVINQPTSMTLDQAQAIVDQAHHQQPNGTGYNPSDGYNTHDSANHAINNAASALYLLSQQQIQRSQNQAQNALAQGQGQVNPSAVSGPPQQQLPESPTSPTGPTRRATKRKTMEAPAPVPRGKKAKNAAGATASAGVNTRNAGRRKNSKLDEDEDDDFDEDEEDDDTYMDGIMGPPSIASNNRGSSRGGTKKPETEEEKRKNFLERNRQAALKCRQRKKAWLGALQQKVEFLTAENERLSNALVTSREEVARLSQAVVAAGGAPSALLNLDPNGNPATSNAPNGTPMMGNVNLANVSVENNANSPVDHARRGSSSSNNTAPGQIQTSQPVHVNVPQHMANGMSHVQHAHSHSLGHSLPQSHASGMGHSRSHSHGHNMTVPAAQNGVTVGGRGYGY